MHCSFTKMDVADQTLKYAEFVLSKLSLLQKDSLLCDVTISVCGEVFHAHRVMLSAACSYFQVMFCRGMTETFKREVELQGVSAKTFALLLGYIYSGRISINCRNVQDLLAAAKMFQLDSVVSSCCEFLTRELTPCNSIGIFLFSNIHCCKDLYQTALNYIQRNFKDVTRSEEFLQIDKQTLQMFIESDEIKVDKEEDVFVAVVAWILHDLQERRHFVGDLFRHVKLPLLSPQCVVNHLEACPTESVKKLLYSSYQESLKLQQLAENRMYHHPRTHSLKYFYIIGGYTRKSDAQWNETVSLATVERCGIELSNHSLTQYICPINLCSMNHPRNSLGVAVCNGLVYAIGGENDSLIYDSVECYNPVMDQWNLVAPMVAPRVGLGACVVDNEIYIVGGWVGSEIAKTMEKYNPFEDSWVLIGNVATPRYHAGVCELNGMIFVAGGMDDAGEDLQTVDCYDPVREKWNSIAAMQHKRSCAAVVSLGGYIYAIGGCNAAEGSLDSVEKYDVEKNCWEEVKPMPRALASACATDSGSCIYVFGGRTLDYPPKILDSIDCYDTKTNTWFITGKLLSKRSEAGVVMV